tara:strand:+ start:221 stop:880 length:660 start_codon:yes stop_codon:yes gene_type:complete
MEIYKQEGIEALANAGRPIPGQSLTSDPEQKRPFESPPQNTNFKEALDSTVSDLLLPENYIPLIKAVGDGVPITDLAMQIGYVGFREGKWNPDLMLMLMEPFMYTLMALAEKAGVEYRIDGEDDDMENEEEQNSILEEKTKNIAEVAKAKLNKNKGIPINGLPANIVEDIKKLDIKEDSLLDKPSEEAMPTEAVISSEEPSVEEEEPPVEQKSLLSKGQ